MEENLNKNEEEHIKEHKSKEEIDKKTFKKLAKKKRLMEIRKETLIREEALDKATLSKIKDKWHETLLNIKLPEMRENLKHILQFMEKLVEVDHHKKLLIEEDRQDIYDSFTLQSQCHRTALERLYDIYETRLEELHNTFNERFADKRTQFNEELAALERRDLKKQENMQAMLYQMQQNRNQREEVLNCEMFLKLDDERSRNTEKYENLRTKLKKKMEKRWGEIVNTVKYYQKNTDQRRREYTILKTKDDADSKIIYQQMKKTQKLFDQLDEMRNNFDQHYAPKKTIALISDLREEKAKFLETFEQLKSVMGEEIKIDQWHLKTLTTTSDKVTKELRRICEKGERILTLFRICRKFETEREKVLPVGMAANLLKLPEGTRKSREESIVDYQETKNWAKDYEILHKFWVKAANVRFSKLALTRYVENLEKENNMLKKSVSYYLYNASRKK